MFNRIPHHRALRTAPVARGFTLVELLVVISIIALLISILLPSLRAARDQAKLATCLAHIRGTGQAAMTFANDHNQRFQIATDEVGLNIADPDRSRFEYGVGNELLAWPVAIAQGSGIAMRNNWDWGVRATSYADALTKEQWINKVLENVVCPSDRVVVATPFYPKNLMGSGAANPTDGLKGSGDPSNPISSQSGMSYWGRLSFAVNEDIVGAENGYSGNNPGCWRAVQIGGGWFGCRGEASTAQCKSFAAGRRLQGNLDKVFRPGDVGLVFEAGRDSSEQEESTAGNSNLVLSSKAYGPYLGDAMKSDASEGGLASDRIPRKRHPKGRLNVLYCDGHGASIQPTKFDSSGKPTEFSPSVRVSPYQPHDVVTTFR
ncbi:MAG TPA: prepilin-type N-terminal cleavage/methylation domain-containing protein [Phycisphaerae bacterium]|nr:prepilin-type N-terminal cleavage/methylation domain-containing protein [Phycisphaerales bacterium]HRX83886.1 prepilin-type N-terminal cleavage/methylation domain-containing protein [Phycisphaerae bacterium]